MSISGFLNTHRKSWQDTIPLWAVMFLLSCRSSLFADEGISKPSQELLQSALRAVQLPDRFYFHVDSVLHDDWGGAQPPGAPDGGTVTLNLYKDHGRIDMVSLDSTVKGPKTIQNQVLRAVRTDEQMITRQQSLVAGAKTLGVYFTRKPPDAYKMISSSINCGPYLDGWIPGDDMSIPDLFLRSTAVVTSGEEQIGDRACQILEATTPGGKYKVWIDTGPEYHVRKAVVDRSPGDLHYGQAVKQGTTIKISLDGVKVEKIAAGQFIGSEGNVAIATTAKNRTTSDIYSAHRSRFQLDPDFTAAKAFQIQNVPNGTRVQFDDDEKDHFSYVWQDGSVVKSDDGIAVGRIDKAMLEERNEAAKPALK